MPASAAFSSPSAASPPGQDIISSPEPRRPVPSLGSYTVLITIRPVPPAAPRRARMTSPAAITWPIAARAAPGHQQVVAAHRDRDHRRRLGDQRELALQHISCRGPVPGQHRSGQACAGQVTPRPRREISVTVAVQQAGRPPARAARVIINRHRIAKRDIHSGHLAIIHGAHPLH
jgi:hypothetical protein